MHVFADASHIAYAVTCFCRFVYSNGSVVLSFLFGKCKISPVSGSLTIPRLELVAASLATRVACSMLQESNIKYECVLCWSDSTAVLHLIRNNTRRLGVFVDALLAEICGSSLLEKWHYIPTDLNPSDVGPRVISPRNKKQFLPWVVGPEFLLAANYEFSVQPSAKGEIKETISSLISFENVKIENKVDCSHPFEKFVSFIKYYSDFDRLIQSL